MARKVITSSYKSVRKKRKGVHSKNASKGQNGYKASLSEDKGVNLLIIRDTFTEKSVQLVTLFINGELFCDTLENPYINNKRNISCIPEGQYKVRLRLARESASRDYLHLLVQDVPNRDWILFHRGNTAKDTSGCILVGNGREQDAVE